MMQEYEDDCSYRFTFGSIVIELVQVGWSFQIEVGQSLDILGYTCCSL